MRLTETAPAACSCCYQAKPDQPHVDFEVAYDGPTIPGQVIQGDGDVTNGVPVVIDDLILCEQCLRSAAGLVGMVNPDETQAELEQLRESNRLLTEKLRGQEDYTSKLQTALGAKPEPARKPARKPATAGV